jgi:hypothetical protein
LISAIPIIVCGENPFVAATEWILAIFGKIMVKFQLTSSSLRGAPPLLTRACCSGLPEAWQERSRAARGRPAHRSLTCAVDLAMQPRAGTMQVTRMGPWGWREDEAGVTQGLRMDDSWPRRGCSVGYGWKRRAKGKTRKEDVPILRDLFYRRGCLVVSDTLKTFEAKP